MVRDMMLSTVLFTNRNHIRAFDW